MLYELLTGQPPFRGATAMATLHDVMESEPAAPRRLNANLPRDLETKCLKCLEKSPPARYPTARALAEELDRFLKGEPIQARPAGAVRKAVSWARRHPGTLSALAALAIVTLAFGVFYQFEEIAFLRAQQTDPTLTRTPGPRHEALQTWSAIDGIVLAASLFLYLILWAKRRGALAARGALAPPYFPTFSRVPFIRFLLAKLPRARANPHGFETTHALGERTRAVAVGVCLILVGCALVHLVTTIQAHVWEGESIWDQVPLVFFSIWLAVAILEELIRDYRLVHYGTSSRQLTAEQMYPIRCALEKDFDYFTAVKYYREAAPEASLAEAKQYVMRLFKTLLAKRFGSLEGEVLALMADPGRRIEAIKIYRDQTGVGLKEAAGAVDALAAKHGIGPKGAGCAGMVMAVVSTIIGAVALGVFLAAVPANPSAYVSQFGYAFLLTLALLYFGSVKGLWKRILCFVPGLVAMVFSVAILPWLTDVGPASLTPYLTGVLLGISLKFFNLGLHGILGKEEHGCRSRGERILVIFLAYLIGLSVLLAIVFVVILFMP